MPGFSAHDELRELVTVGLTVYEALQAGTINAAEALGRENDLGTVALGKSADLILVDANPLESIANVARVAGVMIGGRWLPRVEIQRKLDHLVDSNK